MAAPFRTSRDANSLMGTANAIVAAKKMRRSHCMRRLTWRAQESCTSRSVQKERPERKAPRRGEEPSAWQSGTRISASSISMPSRTFGSLFGGIRGFRRLMSPGTTFTPKNMPRERRPADDTIGSSSDTADGSSSAWSSESKISAMMSSSTAAEITSWPVGVLSTLPRLSTFSATPIEVGASVQPMASAERQLRPSTPMESVVAIASGASEPEMATPRPRSPMRRSISKSTSSPASMTSSINPTSP